MSLIHKALKKTEGGGEGEVPPDPEESFAEGKSPSQFTPRTIVLLVIALGALGFMIYKNFIRKPKSPALPAATETAMPATGATQTGQTLLPPQAAGTTGQAPGPDKLTPPGSLGTGAKAVEETPLPPDVAKLVDEGKALFTTGQYDAALSKFEGASQLAPDEAIVWNDIGLVQKRRQKLEESEVAYKKAIELKPSFPEGLNNLGVLKAAQGDRLSGVIYLKKALAIDPTYSDAHFNLAVIMEQEGNWRSAAESYKAFLQYTASTDKALLEQVSLRVEELTQ